MWTYGRRSVVCASSASSMPFGQKGSSSVGSCDREPCGTARTPTMRPPRRPPPEWQESVTTTTGEGGAYTFPSLAPDDYTISVAVGDGLATSPASRSVELTDNEIESGVNFEVIAGS